MRNIDREEAIDKARYALIFLQKARSAYLNASKDFYFGLVMQDIDVAIDKLRASIAWQQDRANKEMNNQEASWI